MSQTLSGIRLDSNQVTHILDCPSDDKQQVGETLATAALCSPVRRPRPPSRQNFYGGDVNSSRSSTSQTAPPSWVSPTRQRNPLSNSSMHSNQYNHQSGSLLHAPLYQMCIGESASPEEGPETISPTRRQNVALQHNADGTPWRRQRSSNQGDEENVLDLDLRVEIEQEQRRGGGRQGRHESRRLAGESRRVENAENDLDDSIVSTRRPFQFMRSLG